MKDITKFPLIATFKNENGTVINGIINEGNTRDFLDGAGERLFFEPDSELVAPFWVPISKIEIKKPMRVLAVRQPWASLIVEGLKTIEVRSRPTNIRERVGIYASSHIPSALKKSTFYITLDELEKKGHLSSEQKNFAEKFARISDKGCIIGTVEIVDCNPVDEYEIELKKMKKHHFVYDVGYYDYFWELENPVKFETPIPINWPSTGSWASYDLPGAHK